MSDRMPAGLLAEALAQALASQEHLNFGDGPWTWSAVPGPVPGDLVLERTDTAPADHGPSTRWEVRVSVTYTDVPRRPTYRPAPSSAADWWRHHLQDGPMTEVPKDGLCRCGHHTDWQNDTCKWRNTFKDGRLVEVVAVCWACGGEVEESRSNATTTPTTEEP